jgi:hypothetical protein
VRRPEPEAAPAMRAAFPTMIGRRGAPNELPFGPPSVPAQSLQLPRQVWTTAVRSPLREANVIAEGARHLPVDSDKRQPWDFGRESVSRGDTPITTQKRFTNTCHP